MNINVDIFEVGTFQIQGGDLIEKVLNIALGAGYRHIGICYNL